MLASNTGETASSRLRAAVAVAAAAIALCALAAGTSAVPAQAGSLKRLMAPTSVCPKQNDIRARAGVQERAMRCLVNYARARSGERRLTRSRRLARSAGHKSRDIRRCRSFDHSACGRDFTFWMRRVGFAAGCWSGAENIAWGRGRRGSARKIFASWLRSSSHQANLLDISHTAIGIGLRPSRSRGRSRTQVWTAHLGRRC